MPNHVQNILNIESENDDLILSYIKNEETNQFIDFNKVLPMPEELENTCSPVRIISKEERAKALESGIPNTGLTIEEKDKLVDKYGHADWYSWRLENWGTKWNAYEQEINDNGDIVFQTAWCTPLEVIEKLSVLFPDAVFTVQYADEDLGYNCGEYQFTNGEFYEISRMDGEEYAVEFANELWGNY